MLADAVDTAIDPIPAAIENPTRPAGRQPVTDRATGLLDQSDSGGLDHRLNR
jgi:hypothetical protein